MTDNYETYLRGRIEWYTNKCMDEAAENGRPGNIKWASQSMRYALMAIELVKRKFQELIINTSATAPDSEQE